MDRDIRQTPLYRKVEAHYQAAHAPAFGRISDASDLAPSPDGRVIAFSGSRMQRLEGVPETRICQVPLPAGPLEVITAGPNDDLMPRWSPDGARLAFLSDRKQKGLHQLYLLGRERLGEALPTPWIEGAVEYLDWSPDGRTILLGVAGPGADIADARGAGTTGTRAEDLPSWMPQVDSGAAENKWRRLWLYDVMAGTSRLLSRDGVNVWEAAWAGNDRIIAVISPAPGEGAWYTAQLARIDASTGQEEVAYSSPRQMGVPAASPSGDHVAVIQALCSDRGVVAGDLLLFGRGQGAPRAIDSAGVDVTHLTWRDEQHIFYAGLRGLQTVFGDVEVASGRTRELWTTGESSGGIFPQAAPLDGDDFAVALQSYARFPEITVVRDGTPTSVVSLAHTGSDYMQRVGGVMEEVSWTAPDGLRIEGLLARPTTPGPYPLVLDVHGGPVSSFRNRWSGYQDLTRLLVSRGYAVLHPNPRGSVGRGQAFAEMVYGDMGGADTDDYLSGLDALVERGIADPARLGTMGVSYGGFMSSWLITRTDRFAAAVSMSPVNEWRSMHYTTYFPDFDRLFLQDESLHVGGEYDARSPLMFAQRVRTPTLHTSGGLDEATPASQAVMFHRALLENGVESVLVIYPEEGHNVHRFPAIIDRATRVVAWFERFMPASVT
jgi:dipeptidyl aminopeptidase/acylaminoacyl peptidase